ncbi:hypothetical protein, partial [Wohlfahrtiimonas larvae]|uniref:hypothetical protein n=1 Tax=Wohlfahrtiimonas larvae TaxID=1157986 RepID=UPI0015C541AB
QKAIEIWLQKPPTATAPVFVIQGQEFGFSSHTASYTMSLVVPPGAEYYQKSGTIQAWKELF